MNCKYKQCHTSPVDHSKKSCVKFSNLSHPGVAVPADGRSDVRIYRDGWWRRTLRFPIRKYSGNSAQIYRGSPEKTWLVKKVTITIVKQTAATEKHQLDLIFEISFKNSIIQKDYSYSSLLNKSTIKNNNYLAASILLFPG